MEYAAKYGFGSSEAKAKALMERGSDPRSEMWGFPLTSAEADDLEGRMRFSKRVKASVVPYLESLDGYAGHWFDNERQGMLVVMLTNPGPAKTSAIRSRMPVVSRGFEVREATHTERQLQAAFDRAWATAEKVSPAATLAAVSIDVPGNRIEVQVLEQHLEQAKADKLALEKELGVDVVLKAGTRGRDLSCPSRAKCFDPLRAGTQIYNNYANSGFYCAMGFHVKDSTVNNAWDETFFTAGHCAYDKNTGNLKPDDWHQDSAFGWIGNKKKNGYLSDARDIMLVKISDWSNQKSSRVFGGFGGDPAYVVGADWPSHGETVCTSLAKSKDTRCGTVTTATNEWWSETKKLLVKGAAINWSNSIPDLEFGDSGSPVYTVELNSSDDWEATAIGIVDHERNPAGVYGGHDVYFAKVKWAMNNWGLSLYTGLAND